MAIIIATSVATVQVKKDVRPKMGAIEQKNEEIFNELDKILAKIMRSLASQYHISGHTSDDLVQEMRIKVWDIVRTNKYDPLRCKETSFFYRVFRNMLTDMSKRRDMLKGFVELQDFDKTCGILDGFCAEIEEEREFLRKMFEN